MTSEGPTEMENEGGEGRSIRMTTDTIFYMKTSTRHAIKTLHFQIPLETWVP